MRAATSGLYGNGERMAMLYLAREYFDSEEIKHYLAKIDKALKTAVVLPRRRKQIAGKDVAPPVVVAVSPVMGEGMGMV